MDKKAEYLAKFKTFSHTKQHRHVAIAAAFLVKLLQEKQQAAHALDVDVVDGECTVGDAG